MGRILSVCLMIFCLTFLTAINYFIYPGNNQTISDNIGSSNAEESSNNFPPSGPTEEKSSSSGFSFSEEILHESVPEFNFQAINHMYLHHIANAEKIKLFYPELILRPPKL